MNPALVRAIEEVRRLTVAALKIRYRKVVREESRSSSKQFLFRRIAWQLQVNAEGDVSERARRRAAEIADERDVRRPQPHRQRRRYGLDLQLPLPSESARQNS